MLFGQTGPCTGAVRLLRSDLSWFRFREEREGSRDDIEIFPIALICTFYFQTERKAAKLQSTSFLVDDNNSASKNIQRSPLASPRQADPFDQSTSIVPSVALLVEAGSVARAPEGISSRSTATLSVANGSVADRPDLNVNFWSWGDVRPAARGV